MKATITLNELGEKFEGSKIWTGGDKVRLYVKEGYNTKTTRTTCYVYVKDGNFEVFCSVDCPKQSIAWEQAEANKIKERVLSKINDIINPQPEEEFDIVVAEPQKAILGDGKRVSHPNFGLGEVISENDTKIEVLFEIGGLKPFLKAFANLTYL